MRRIFALLALLLAAAAPLRAQSSTLVLRVLDERGHPLHRALVSVAGVRLRALSDEHGIARVEGVQPGERMVHVARESYGPRDLSVTFTPGEVRQEVRMAPDPIEVEGVTATSWGRSMHLRRVGFYERQQRGVGSFMTGDELMAHAPINTNEAFHRMRGFSLAAGTGSDMVVMTMRGTANLGGGSMSRIGRSRPADGGTGGGSDGAMGLCQPQIYVDGMLMAIRTARDQADLFRQIPPSDVEAIEAYPSPSSIPVEYNTTGSACGVVLIWTYSGGQTQDPAEKRPSSDASSHSGATPPAARPATPPAPPSAPPR